MQVKIEKVVPGGAGLARVDGKVVFVEGALPGETVEITGDARKGSGKGYSRSRVSRIIDASPGRRNAPCEYYGRCGGCDLQHADERLQLELKKNIVSDTLRRQGKLDPSEHKRVVDMMETFSGNAFAYRNRFQFHAGKNNRPGFKMRQGAEVVEIDRCEIAGKEVNSWLAGKPAIPAIRQKVDHKVPVGRRGISRSKIIHEAGGGPVNPVLDDDIGAPDRYPVFAAGGRLYRDDQEIELKLQGKDFVFSNKSFFQSNVEMVEQLLIWQKEALGQFFEVKNDKKGRSLSAVDLYCGVGLFAAYLPESFTLVEAVDFDPENTDFARRNTDPRRTEVLNMSVDDWILNQNEKADSLDLAIVDPPRVGLSQKLRSWIRDFGPPVVFYVSCDPVTLARDIADLPAYRIESFAFFDFYPQTSRIETACVLKRT